MYKHSPGSIYTKNLLNSFGSELLKTLELIQNFAFSKSHLISKQSETFHDTQHGA